LVRGEAKVRDRDIVPNGADIRWIRWLGNEVGVKE